MVILNNKDSIGRRIKAQRLNMRMTQEQLAEAMHVPKSTISAYENDRVDIKSSVILELSDLLCITPNYLLGIYGKGQFYDEVISMLNCIKDRKIKEMLLIQIQALTRV